MIWRKRRRKWTLSVLTFLCFVCGIGFITGNIYLLHSGALLTRHTGEKSEDSPVREQGSDPVEGVRLRDYIDVPLQVLFDQKLLPSDFLYRPLLDNQLRKLMGNQFIDDALISRQVSAPNPKSDKNSNNPMETGNTGKKSDSELFYSPNRDPQNIRVDGSSKSNQGLPHGQRSSRLHSNKFQITEVSHPVEGSDDNVDERWPKNDEISSNTARLLYENVIRELARTSQCAILGRSKETWQYLGSGWTKAVYRAQVEGHSQPVAVKTVDDRGHDVTRCQDNRNLSFESCYELSERKLTKELILLRALQHPHIVQVLDYCVSRDGQLGDHVTVATELGDSVDIIKLLQMSWEDRLKVSYDLTRLLSFLASSAFGSLAIHDFRRQQFVLVDSTLKLTDVDDLGFDEPACRTDDDCIHDVASGESNLRTRCRQQRCENYNEMKNILNAGRHFTTFLLPHGAPSIFRPLIDDVIVGFSNASLRSDVLLSKLNNITRLFKSGAYLGVALANRITTYTCYESCDLPGMFDYHCRYSITGAGCTLSVYDQSEAEVFCNDDPDCHAFVLSDQRTWTGRIVAHLKSNTTRPVTDEKKTLCLKPQHVSQPVER